MISKKLVAASILAAMGTSAHAIGFKAGEWEMDLSGSINASYTNLNCKRAGPAATIAADGALNPCGSVNSDSQGIQNGLLPGFLIFTAKTKQNGYDLSGVISIDPGTTKDNGTAGGVGQSLGDQRRVYLTFGNANMGTIKLGRDIGLFGQNAILNDMSLLAVGGGAGFRGGLNTTLGSIGAGYVYTEFQPQITYTTPTMGGFSASFGAFQAKDPFPTATAGSTAKQDNLGYQGLASYNFGAGKVWATFLNQSDLHSRTVAGRTVREDVTAYELGGTVGFGALQLTGNVYSGEGLGTALIGFGGTDATGRARDSSGYFTQATYKFGDTKVGVNYGQSKLDANAADTALMLDKTKQAAVGVYHNLTPSLTLTGEYIQNKQSYQRGAGAPEAKANTIALGAILFF